MASGESGEEVEFEEVEEIQPWVVTAPSSLNVQDAERRILRIEEMLQHKWSGVSGCKSRKDKEVKSTVNSWIAKKMFAYKDAVYIRAGLSYAVKPKCSNNRGPLPERTRTCGCSVTLPVFIEFSVAQSA